MSIADGAMIPYVGLPITPGTAAVTAVRGGHAFVSWAHPEQMTLAAEICQSFAVDNGAFPAWKNKRPIRDWAPFYGWAAACKRLPNCDFAVIPDVIDGDEMANDALLAEWPLGRVFGAPVWHMHEGLERLERLVSEYHRVCIGSSAQFAVVGSPQWETRMMLAMHVACDAEGYPKAKLHGLRMLNPRVFERFPFTSADSTNIGRNIGIDKAWKNAYPLPDKSARALAMRLRLEAFNSPTRYEHLQD